MNSISSLSRGIAREKAISRYMVSNVRHFASFPYSPAGLEQAKAFRSITPCLKRRRIRGVIQCYPEQVPVGKLIEYT